MSLLSLDAKSREVFVSFDKGAMPAEVISKFPESSGLLKKLVEGHFLVNEKADEIGVVRKLLGKRTGIDINMMYLLLTDRCNLNCRYCFIEGVMGRDYSFTDMSENIMKKAVDLYLKLSEKTEGVDGRKINFYGGEPLLRRDLIKSAILYIRSKDLSKSIGLNMVTNGCLLNKDIAKFLSDYEVLVGVSIDGDKKTHDSARTFIDGHGTFDEAIIGFMNLKNAGSKHAGISLTIGKHNADRLKQNVQFLVEKLQPVAFGFNFIVDVPGRENPLSVPIEYATDRALEAFDYLRHQGIFEERIMRKIQPFVKKTIHLKDCGAIGNQIIVAPDGRIGPCHAFLGSRKYFSQTVESPPESIKSDYCFLEWSKRYPLNMEKCLGCPAVGLCGGGCPYQAEIKTGSIWNLDERMCKHNLKVLEWILNEVGYGI